MEAVTVSSELGVTIALYQVFYIDFPVHNENYKRSIAGELSKEPLTVPSVIRRLQYENMAAFIQRVQEDEDFVRRWIKVAKDGLERNRKKHKKLININESDDYGIKEAV